MLDLPNDKATLIIYIQNYIEMLDKNTYPTGKREYVRWCLNKAREKLKKIKK
jgi:hypothetical protein